MITYENMLMMMYVLIGVFVFLVYRSFCLKISLKYENKVIKYLDEIYNDPSIDDRIKEFAHWEYRSFLSFWFLIFIPIVIPLGRVIYNKQKVRKEKENLELSTKEFDEFLNNLYKAAFIRRPVFIIMIAVLTVILSCLVNICLIILAAVMMIFSRQLDIGKIFVREKFSLYEICHLKNNS